MASAIIVSSPANFTETAVTSPWTVDEDNQSASGIPEGCIILGLNSTIPWDNPYNLVSLEAEHLFDRVKSAILIPVLFLIGFPANCVNMVVFFKQGLRKRINLCLFSLALLHLICLTEIFVIYAERIYSQFTDGERMGSVHRYMVNHNVVGLYGFLYGPMFLSAVISAERCICVLFPMRAERCISTKAIALLIVTVVLVLGFGRFAITAMFQVTCFYEMRTQRLSWKLYVKEYYFRNKAMITVLDGVIYGLCLTVGCPVIVLIATIITAVKLAHAVRWRHQTSSSLSSKEIGVTKMLIALSIEFFVLSIPMIVLRIVPVFEPTMTLGDVHANTLYLLLGLSELCSYTSSSVNFFVYYFTGTKYRHTFRELTACRKPGKRTGSSNKCGSIATVSNTYEQSLTSADHQAAGDN